MMAQMAHALGKDEDAKSARFTATVRTSSRRPSRKNGCFPDNGELTVRNPDRLSSRGLAFNLFPENVRTRAAERLVDNIKNLDWHLSTGFIGISPSSIPNSPSPATPMSPTACSSRMITPPGSTPSNTVPPPFGNAGTAGPTRTASSIRK